MHGGSNVPIVKGGDEYGQPTQATQGQRGSQAIEIVADKLRARRPGFKRRVERALTAIREASGKGAMGVAFSGGKDSTVLLDLVRQVLPDVPSGFYDSECEYAETYTMIDHYEVETIKPEQSLIEMCKAGGYWGYDGPDLIDPDLEFNFGYTLITEPAWRFADKYELATIAIGLRAGESYWRKFTALKRGEIYFHEGNQIYHFCPLAWWTTDDIWAYINNRGLRYHSAYDKMTELGISRDEQRISTLLGSDYASHGRYAHLRQIDPAMFKRLAADFPKIARLT